MNGIATKVDVRAVVRLNGELTNWLKTIEQEGNPERLREALVAMAEVLQRKLSAFPSRNVIPHSSSLELLMRAVAHDLEGSPTMEYLVEENLDAGYHCLLNDLRLSVKEKTRRSAKTT